MDTGSLRGMPHLLELADAGFSIWPFDSPELPVVVEIYPRLLTGKLQRAATGGDARVSRSTSMIRTRFLRERAAGSEDAFDAAVSAIVMSRHADECERLPTFPAGSPEAIEGAIWAPTASASPSTAARTDRRHGSPPDV